MSQLLETLLFRDGKLHHVPWHNARLNRTRLELFGQSDAWDIGAIFDAWYEQHGTAVTEPEDPTWYCRCRILYAENGIDTIEIVAAKRRKVDTLQLVEDNQIEYAYKWANRLALENLSKGIAADDILIVKNGLLTDTTYANIVFSDGHHWFTPATPLLQGTKRAQLLAQNRIKTAVLRVPDLHNFKEARLLNTTTDLHNSPSIAIENIRAFK
jgi:4-amino-4-deoxychorismate lyase